MVAFEQNLVAAANAHHLMTQPVYARGVVTRAEQQEYSQENSGKKSKASTGKRRFSHRTREMGHLAHGERVSHQSPAPTGAGRTRTSAATFAETVARAGAAFGTSATIVPKIITSTPIHIQETSGFKCALMIGRPVSGFWPS